MFEFEDILDFYAKLILTILCIISLFLSVVYFGRKIINDDTAKESQEQVTSVECRCQEGNCILADSVIIIKLSNNQ